MLFWYDQLVSRSSLLGYVNADHWSVAIPLSREMRAVNFLFHDDAVPRTLLVEAAIEVVDEALRAPRRAP